MSLIFICYEKDKQIKREIYAPKIAGKIPTIGKQTARKYGRGGIITFKNKFYEYNR